MENTLPDNPKYKAMASFDVGGDVRSIIKRTNDYGKVGMSYIISVDGAFKWELRSKPLSGIDAMTDAEIKAMVDEACESLSPAQIDNVQKWFAENGAKITQGTELHANRPAVADKSRTPSHNY